ncbi:sensor domain-containing diguanylate cyclase [Citrobacter farmeri]|uniref:sensor domain-containing diguanylate cyclase n=1 Tax=Citrobacter farmeri TaxID=67824 RepID=UPI00189D7933|nr:sensor domain-containing diguanylate cyclase [Citrobacter farmeri]EKU0079966.1 sensor domain-containing diguanylate cyclase [Citrobacter farmeri]MDZ7527325.1 sensor domain-containing diguanylate cyclase [Citrobacter farmeri]HCD1998062.1 sensor domain-containing diguanylate cyclase [Citrobacter farmeri]
MSDLILARVSQSLATEQSFESLVRQLLEMLERVTDMESTYLTKVDIDARLQHILYARNSKQMQIPEDLSVPWDDTLCKRAMDADCFYSDNVPDRWKDCTAARALGITTFLSTPVHLPDGTFYGTLCATSSQQQALSERGEEVLHLFAGLIAHYLQKESLVSQLREANAALVTHSYTDVLTGLPNRRAIFESMDALFSRARQLRRNVTVVYIDLDNFKLINDRYGHEVGDQFLIQVGERLGILRGADDIIGRLGGDEFLVACLSETADDDLQVLKGRIQQHIRGEYHLGETAIFYPGASLGIVAVDPLTMDVDSALRHADCAMYRDKKREDKTPFVTH